MYFSMVMTAGIPFSQVSPLSTATDLSTPHFSLKTTTRPSEVLLKTLSGAILSQELKIISGYASHTRSRRDDEGKKNHGTPQVSVYITNLIRARTSGKAQTNQWTFLCKESRLFSAASSEVWVNVRRELKSNFSFFSFVAMKWGERNGAPKRV